MGKRLVEKLKVHTVASDPANEALNKKMWALCDLAHTLLMSKSLEMTSEVAVEPVIPPLHFKPHPEGSSFTNTTLYIPAELATSTKTNFGLKRHPHSAVIKRAQQREEGAPNNENDANEKNGSSDPVGDQANDADMENEDSQAAKRLKHELEATEESSNGRPRRGTRRN